MKNHLIVLLAVFSFTLSFAQQKTTYVLVDDDKSFTYNQEDSSFGTYEMLLKLKNGNDTDIFEFVVNADISDDWAKKNKELPNPSYLTITDLAKKELCELHIFLSDQRALVVLHKEGGKTKYLFVNYLWTYRNMVMSKLPKM